MIDNRDKSVESGDYFLGEEGRRLVRRVFKETRTKADLGPGLGWVFFFNLNLECAYLQTAGA